MVDTETLKSILHGVVMEMIKTSDAQDPVVAKADEKIHKQVQETAILARAAQAHISIHVTALVTAQQEDPILKAMIEWMSNWKVQDLKPLLRDNANTEEGKIILQEQKKLIFYQRAFYHHHTPTGKLEEVLQFVVTMPN